MTDTCRYNGCQAANVQKKIQSVEDNSNKSVNAIDEEMSTALSAALLSTWKITSLKAKPWTTPEFLALHDHWCKLRERFHAGGKCPAVRRKMLTLQKQVHKRQEHCSGSG